MSKVIKDMGSKVGNWFMNMAAIAGLMILGIWIFQGLESSNTNPKTEITLVGGDMSKYKMLSCTTHVMSNKDKLSSSEYEKSMHLCTDNHVSKERFKSKLKNFSKGGNSTYLNVDFDNLKKSEQAVAEMLNKLNTKTKDK